MKQWALLKPGWQKVILYLVVLCVTVFLAAVLQWFVMRQFSSQLTEIQNEQLQHEVQELSASITERYGVWQAELKELSSSLGRDMLNEGKRQFPEEFKRDTGSFYVLDEQYRVLAGRNNRQMKSAVQQIKWLQNGCAVSPSVTEDHKPAQFIVCRIQGAQTGGFMVRTVDADMLSEIIKSKPVNQHEVLFYNNQFKVVASRNTSDINRTDITNITRKMLEGNTGVIEDNGERYGIGFSRIGEEALYISVEDVSQEIAQRISSFRKQLWTVMALVLIMLWVMFVQFRRRIVKDTLVNNQIRDRRRDEDLRQQQDTYYLPLMQTVEQRLQELQEQTARLTGGDDLKLLGFYHDLANCFEASSSQGKGASHKELEYFRELNENFIQGRLRQESSLGELLTGVRTLRDILEEMMHDNSGIRFTDMNEVLSESLKWANRSLNMKNIQVILRQEPVPSIAAQAQMLYKTIQGLLENAVQAMNKGEDQVENKERSRTGIRSKRQSQVLKVSSRLEEGEILIIIEDTGGGIDDKKRWSYFQPDYSQSSQEHTFSLYHMDEYLKTIGGRLKLRNTDQGLQAIVSLRR
ncbi:ATP-binding protein [Paenibacillus farraposensis]|uniref:histidine kinase n=1 Tax=Paenibacillus farraposensis TaxID=2807095 RepID=A0ABW4DER3_9BACL|nr:ATP-binding protein [Paenibacillus farraposensis]MCC3378715.1 HAMP domain-containing histidine kinase [Paenibacillus farraposensis]